MEETNQKTQEEVCEVSRRVRWYEEISLEEAKTFIRSNIATAARSFIAVGYYLKNVRDRELYREDGYETIWEFAQAEYGISKSTASRYMAMNDRFSENGNSPIVRSEYREFSRSQLQEMLYLTEEELEQVTPEIPVIEIRQMRQNRESEEEIPGQMQITDFPEYLPEPYFSSEEPLAIAAQTNAYQITVEDMIEEESVAMPQQETEKDIVAESQHMTSVDKRVKEIHKKILPEFYEPVEKEKKHFELRKDEDNVQPDDILFLHEWDGISYTGRTVRKQIQYVLRNVPEYGLMDGYCILGW